MPTTREIAERLNAALTGSGDVEITGVAGIREAGPSDITFLSRPRYAAEAEKTGAGAVVVGEAWEGTTSAVVIRVAKVDVAFAEIADWLSPEPPRPQPGLHSAAVVADSAAVGDDVSIGPCCVVEDGASIGARTVLHAGCYIGRDAEIGSDCLFYPYVSLRERVRIGDRTVIHNGTVIGSDGYGYIPEEKDGKVTIRKVPQTGIVEVGHDVEIGACVTVDRARLGSTKIGNHVKIDNLVHVAHNVVIGDYCGIAAQVGIAGSSTIGSRVILWGQAGVGGHLAVGDGAVVGAQAGVTKDVSPGDYVTGYPAMSHDRAAKSHAHLMRIPHLKKRLSELEKRVRQLEEDRHDRERGTQ